MFLAKAAQSAGESNALKARSTSEGEKKAAASATPKKDPLKPAKSESKPKTKEKSKGKPGSGPKGGSKAGGKSGKSLAAFAVKQSNGSRAMKKKGVAKGKEHTKLRISKTGELKRIAKILKGSLSPAQALSSVFSSPSLLLLSCQTEQHGYPIQDALEESLREEQAGGDYLLVGTLPAAPLALSPVSSPFDLNGPGDFLLAR